MTTTDTTITTATVVRCLKHALSGSPVRKVAMIVDLPVADVEELLTANGHPDEKAMRRALERLQPPNVVEVRRTPSNVTVLPAPTHTAPTEPTPDDVIAAAQKSTAPKVKRAVARAVKARQAFADAMTALTDVMGEDREAAKVRAEIAALEKKLAAARAKLGPNHSPSPAPRRPVLPDGVTYKDIRAWAALNDVDCPITGRVPNRVIDAYVHAHSSAGRVEALHEAAWPTPRPGAEA